MKKHYFMLLGAALLGLSANAETITLTEDGTLASAIANAAEGDVIELAVNQTISGGRITMTDKNLTIQGANPDISIIRATNLPNTQLVLLCNGTSNITLKNLTCDGNNISIGKHFIEISASATVNLDNVKFTNAINTTANGIVKINSNNARLTLNNCSFTNCSVPENGGNVYVGSDKVTVSGNTSTSFSLERSITATNYTGNSEIYIVKNITAGGVVVKGATEGFTLKGMSADYSLEPKDGNLMLAYNAVVVLNEATGEGYSSFMEAYNALAAVEGVSPIILSVRENSQITDRIGASPTPAFTVVGAAEGITLSKTFRDKLLVSNYQNMGFENITIDCANQSNNKFEFEVNQNNATVSLKDSKIINSASSVGIFTVKEGNRILSLNNVKVEGYEGSVGVRLNGKLRLEGNNVIPAIVIANAGAEISVVGEGITNETPIEITFDGVTPAQDMVVVKGCTDASKFNFENTENWVLAAKDGNLVLANTTGIEGIVADDNAPVEYFNLQGVRVANPENGLYIRRQGSKVQKVLVK